MKNYHGKRGCLFHDSHPLKNDCLGYQVCQSIISQTSFRVSTASTPKLSRGPGSWRAVQIQMEPERKEGNHTEIGCNDLKGYGYCKSAKNQKCVY